MFNENKYSLSLMPKEEGTIEHLTCESTPTVGDAVNYNILNAAVDK